MRTLIMSEQMLWKKIIAELELEVSPAVFNTLFKQSRLVSVSEGVATISCTSPMIQRLIETRYYGLLKRLVDRHAKGNVSLLFTADRGGAKTREKTAVRGGDIGPLFAINDTAALLLKKYHLRADYTFETFAVSTTNQLAFAAASHVAKNPGDSYNPFFLYGGVGVGKTHLMHAVAQTLLAKNQALRLVLCAGEEFTNEIVEAIRTKTTPSFRNKFRKADVLCIDDVQFIAGKETVQEEFFHTFNAVLREGGQIILTSDKHPTEILKLDARLQSRLEGGLLIDIAPPDFELRTAILLIKATNKSIELPLTLAKMIAATVTDTRGLEGVLSRIITEVQLKQGTLSEDLILRVLGKKYNAAAGEVEGANGMRGRRLTKDAFFDAVCAYYDLKPTQLKGKRRNQSLVVPRQILMYLLRTELGAPLVDIGSLIGGRDHTTVMHAVEKIGSMLATSGRIREDISGIKKILYG